MPFRNFLVIIALLIFFQFAAPAQPVFQWAQVIGDSSVPYWPESEHPLMAVDAAGNQYIAGRFTSIIDIDPRPRVQLFYPTPTSVNGTDFYLLKLNANGNFVWARHINFEVVALEVDKEQDALLVGKIRGDSVDVDPGPDTSILKRYNYFDQFLCKWDSNGVLRWSYYPQGAQIEAVASDLHQNVIITGHFTDTVDFDPGPSSAKIELWSVYCKAE